jgi:WD40 repeat protein
MQIRDLATGLPAVIIPDMVGVIAWHPNGNWLVSGHDGDLTIWDSHTGERLTTVGAECPRWHGVTWSRTHLAASCLDRSNEIIIWEW